MSPAPPPPPPDFTEQRLAVGGGIGWPEVFALEARYRPEPRVGIGAWFAVNGPLAALYATPMAYYRFYLEGGRNSPFVQFGAGSRVRGLFGGEAFTASPWLLATYGYEWRLPGGFTGSADLGGVFDFALTGASPILRLGLRAGFTLL